MTSLPHAARALVEDAKVRDYLLNPDNAQNGGKAALFAQFGFERGAWTALQHALARHPMENPVLLSMVSQHGTKYVVECALRTPDGRNPCLRSVWIVDHGAERPRLVTAY